MDICRSILRIKSSSHVVPSTGLTNRVVGSKSWHMYGVHFISPISTNRYHKAIHSPNYLCPATATCYRRSRRLLMRYRRIAVKDRLTIKTKTARAFRPRAIMKGSAIMPICATTSDGRKRVIKTAEGHRYNLRGRTKGCACDSKVCFCRIAVATHIK